MANMFHCNIRVNDSLSVSKVVTSTQNKKTKNVETDKKFEDVELQTLLNEDEPQTQKQPLEQTGVTQQTVSNRPREM